MITSTNELVSKHINIFKDNAYNGFIISIDKGWLNLVNDALTKIEHCSLPDGFFVEQIKEKFGSLRMYMSHTIEEVENIIVTAEQESKNVCEKCGTTTNITTSSLRGWVRTLCTECRNKPRALR